MKLSKYNHAKFLKSVAQLKQLPTDQGIEVAFAGRSNSGKSSALNTITQKKGLARTSKTPGRTQLINLFELDPERRIVDLPGYGYAKVPLEVKRRWQMTLSLYLESRRSLMGLILLMDIRHPLMPFDQQFLKWAEKSQLATHVLLNKADKLSHGAAANALLNVNKQMTAYNNNATIQLFSSLKETGLKELYQKLDQWFYPAGKRQ